MPRQSLAQFLSARVTLDLGLRMTFGRISPAGGIIIELTDTRYEIKRLMWFLGMDVAF